MPLSSDSVGATGEAVATPIDARWTMAYAAGLGDVSARYCDTVARPDVIAHPMFPVCVEWPVFLSVATWPELGDLSVAERVRGVHFTHRLDLHAPVRAGRTVTTRSTIAAVERHRAGAYQLVRMETTDEDGRPLWTTDYGTLYRGVEIVGEDRRIDGVRAFAAADPRAEVRAAHAVAIPVSAQAAHVYSECARIWNPIHTDAAVAQRAGLPEIILHGTATLALAVSAVIDAELDGDPERVVQIAGRFGAMVPMPSTLKVTIGERREVASDSAESEARTEIGFEVESEAGGPAVRHGSILASGGAG